MHNKTIATMTIEEVKAIVFIYIKRFEVLRQNPNNLLTLIFKNHGSKAGASQPHPHSQIVGFRVVPSEIRMHLFEAQRHFDNIGICVFCRIIDYELHHQQRLVYKNDHFVALSPYASEVPYQVHIYPINHSLPFDGMKESELNAFCDCYQKVFNAIYVYLHNPDFNVVFMNAPHHLEQTHYWHWHVNILPKLSDTAGFELGTRVGINVVAPEDAAKNLRTVTLKED